MDLAELKELGLSQGQIKVYTSILNLGTIGIHEIQEKTGLERRAIYDIVNKLIQKGFVSYVNEKDVRKYQCTHPRNLQELVESKQKTLQNLHNKVPQITNIFMHSKPAIRAEVYRGNDAMKTLLNESLEYEATYWIGGNSGVEICSENMKRWFKHWTKRRIELKRFMYDLVAYKTHLEDYSPDDIKKHKKDLYKYCAMPKNMRSPMVIIIFGTKVAQILWSEQSFAFVIDSKEIQESFMKFFNYFWKDPW